MDLRAIYNELKTLPQEEHLYEFALANWREKAACALAYCYEHGEGGLEQNFSEALRWYRISAERGNREHQWKVACWHFTGKTGRRNYASAKKWFKPFAEEGNVEAIFNIGMCHYNYDGCYNWDLYCGRSSDWFIKAAEMGYPQAMYMLAECYRYGFGGLKENKEEWRKWLIKAGRKGSADALEDLGFAYEHGYYGFEKDQKKALKCCAKGARLGNTYCQWRYGLYLYINQDKYRAAIYWFKKAAEGGCEYSPYWLGSIYENRWIHKPDLRKAAYWYRIGISRKHSSCRRRLLEIEKEWNATHRAPLFHEP